MIKLLIFDFTGVCFTDEETPYLQNLAKEYNIDFEKVNDFYLKYILEAERNNISGIKAWKNFLSDLSLDLDPKVEIKKMMSLKKEITSNFDLLKLLKNKYNLAFFTNYCKEHYEILLGMFDISIFDYGIASYMINSRKPEMKGFNMIMDHFGVNPSETLFIDDSKKNVESAKKLGINIIHLKDAKNLKEDLKIMGILK